MAAAQERAAIAEAVRTIIAEAIEVEDERITDDAYLVVDLGADVLDAVEIEVEIEDRFRISFADGEFEIGRGTRVRDLIALAQAKLDGAR